MNTTLTNRAKRDRWRGDASGENHG